MVYTCNNIIHKKINNFYSMKFGTRRCSNYVQTKQCMVKKLSEPFSVWPCSGGGVDFQANMEAHCQIQVDSHFVGSNIIILPKFLTIFFLVFLIGSFRGCQFQ